MSTEKWKIMKAYEKYGHVIEYKSKSSMSDGAWHTVGKNNGGPMWNWIGYDYRVQPEVGVIPEVTLVYFLNNNGYVHSCVEDSRVASDYRSNNVMTEVTCK